jgi:glutamine phosphoribosylpyrophosphate amidotransferase
MPADSAAFRVARSSVIYVDGKAFILVAEPNGFRPLAVQATPQANQQILLESPALTTSTRIAVKGLAALKSAWLAEKDKKAD